LGARRQVPERKKVSTGVGDRIREARKATSLTQQALSNRSGYSKTQIAQWEIGHRTPGIDPAFNLAQALEVSYSWLSAGLGDMRPSPERDEGHRYGSSLFKACVAFAARSVMSKFPGGTFEPGNLADLAEQLYLAGAQKGLDDPSRSIDECWEFLRTAMQIRVVAVADAAPPAAQEAGEAPHS
jgi:transcriptional regulator with XRE-family HTH domain